MENIFCLVMAGGKGTRFWPESTSQRPKQYLNLVGEENLLRKTLKRFDGLVPTENRFVVTVEEQKDLAQEAGKGLTNPNGIIFEPSGRNTAPCILLSLAQLISGGASKDDIVAIVPADHVILNEEGFRKSIDTARKLALKHKKIVTVGVTPNFPHTGYGYIQQGEALDEGMKVEEFKEKPNYEMAKEYVSSGKYYWNAGMFVAPIGTLLNEFETCSPEIFSYFGKICENIEDSEKLNHLYEEMPSDSIDYAVMEKSKEVMVLAAEFDWNDLGSWEALESVLEKTEENTLVNHQDAYISESKGNIVYAPGKFVSLVNVNDLVIVSNDKVLMVLPKKDSQKVKDIVNFLKNSSKNSLSELI